MPRRRPFYTGTATQIGLVWRLARRVVAEASGLSEDQFVDQDPCAEKNYQQVSSVSSFPQSSGAQERVLKMASIIDQGDDSELLPPTSMEVNNWPQNCMSIRSCETCVQRWHHTAILGSSEPMEKSMSVFGRGTTSAPLAFLI